MRDSAQAVPLPETVQCHAEVSEPPWFIHHYRCARKSKDGPWSGVYLCWQHLKGFDKRGFIRLANNTILRNVGGRMRVER
jgi:hypothetical protein